MGTLFVATAGVETAPLSNGSVVYNLKTSKFVMLNRSANRVWRALAKPLTEQQLVDRVRASYPGIAVPAAQQAVGETLRELRRFELVTDRDGESAPQPGTSDGIDGDGDFEPPSVKALDEEDLLKVFQMSAAEISVALCWWGACSVGCP